MSRFYLAALALAALFATPAMAAVDRPATEAAFRQWLATEIRPAARARGIKRATFTSALGRLTLDWTLPDLRPPGAPKTAPAKQSQAEFRGAGAYFSPSNLATLTTIGRSKLKTWADTLTRIEAAYGVPRRIIVAIWGRETAFGAARLPKSGLRTIATQAFMGRRKALFTGELLAALEMIQNGHITPAEMKSSWAGALGQPQFLPSKFLAHAVDFDGDGKADIWRSVPDTLASIAKYLADFGWAKGRDWGFEAKIPRKLPCTLGGPEQGRAIAGWLALGAARVAGRIFSEAQKPRTGFLLMPAGHYGPAFIVTENFYVLKAYNESDLYALFIGHLADRMAGGGPFVNSWRKTGSFSRRDVSLMQKALERQGHDVGGADGLIGFKTRIAVGKWQAEQARPVTCFPDAQMAKGLR
ncbi:Membrane-bound lytic murein transglycosylase B [hydrothermal vent metagenome]|uniref:Membrane-bound lytic murein transglycosylase B n=1 Tax=hydrothermal vent metagenome TaxID=652676 RepID=A0A3B0U476_9ZZZZ